METMYKNPTEAAKGLRAELKAAFPGTKFSVRTEYFSMGNAIRVSWSFGPTSKAVDAIAKKYEYGRFDGQTDCSSTEDTLISMPNGEVKILGGAKFVQTSRDFRTAKDDYASETAFFERVQADLCALQGIEYAGRNTPFYPNSSSVRDSVSEIANSIIWRADLTKGYNGVRRVEGIRAGHAEEFYAVIPEGEVAAPAPVAPAPVAPAAPAPAPEATATPATVKDQAIAEFTESIAEEILNVYGPALRRMSVYARRAAVNQRCYLRYPSIDRGAVLRAVMGLLTAEVTA